MTKAIGTGALVIGSVLWATLAAPDLALLLWTALVVAPCAIQDLVVAFSGRILKEDQSQGWRDARLIPSTRLVALLALGSYAALAGVPQVVVIYTVSWYFTHNLFKGKSPRAYYEGPSYIGLALMFLLTSVHGRVDAQAVMKSWRGVLWAVIATVTLCAGLSFAPLAHTRQHVLSTLEHTKAWESAFGPEQSQRRVRIKIAPVYVSSNAPEPSAAEEQEAEGTLLTRCPASAPTVSWLQRTEPMLEGPMAWSWYKVGEPLLGCPVGPGDLTEQAVVLKLSGGTDGPAAVVGVFDSATGVVVFTEQLALLNLIDQNRQLAGVIPRAATGLGDFQVFEFVNGGCEMSVRPTYGAAPIDLSTSSSDVILQAAVAKASVVDQILSTSGTNGTTSLAIRLVNPSTQVTSHISIEETPRWSELMPSVGVPHGSRVFDSSASCPYASLDKYSQLASDELALVMKTSP